MSTSGKSMMVERAIQGIRADLLQAVEQLKAHVAEKGQGLSGSTANKLFAGVDAYVAKLKKVAHAKPLGVKKQFAVAEGLLHSYPARLYAVLRAVHKRGAAMTSMNSMPARRSWASGNPSRRPWAYAGGEGREAGRVSPDRRFRGHEDRPGAHVAGRAVDDGHIVKLIAPGKEAEASRA